VAAIAKVAFTSDDRVRDVIRNFNADGFGSLYPEYKGGQRRRTTASRRSGLPSAVLPPSRIGIAAESAARKHAPVTTVRPYWYGPLPWA